MWCASLLTSDSGHCGSVHRPFRWRLAIGLHGVDLCMEVLIEGDDSVGLGIRSLGVDSLGCLNDCGLIFVGCVPALSVTSLALAAAMGCMLVDKQIGEQDEDQARVSRWSAVGGGGGFLISPQFAKATVAWNSGALVRLLLGLAANSRAVNLIANSRLEIDRCRLLFPSS
jgi:hypothetical protein